MARDCLESSYCYLRGEPSSAGFYQGALFIHFLVVMHWLKLDFNTIHQVIFMLQALACALTYLLGSRLFNRMTGIWSALFFIVLYSPFFESSYLWTPALSPLFIVMFTYAAFLYACRKKVRFIFFASLFLALAMNCHLAHAVHLPLLLLLVVAYGRRLWLELPLALLTFTAMNTLLSWHSLKINLIKISTPLGMSLLLLISMIGICIGLALRRKWLSWTPSPRNLLTAGLLLLPLILMLLVTLIYRRDFNLRYLSPAVPILSLITAYMLCWLGTGLGKAISRDRARFWLARGLTGTAAAFFLGFRLYPLPVQIEFSTMNNESWTMQNSEKLSSYFHGRKISYNTLVRHLKSPAMWDLIGAMALYKPKNPVSAAQPNRDLLLFKVLKKNLPSRVPPSWQQIALDGRQVAILRPLLSWLNWSDIEVCIHSPPASRKEESCAQTGLGSRRAGASGSELRISFYYPTLQGVHRWRNPGPYKRTYSIALTIKSDARERVIDLPAFEDTCKCQIEKVSQIPYQGNLPASRVILKSRGAKRGRLIISCFYGTRTCPEPKDRRFLPFIAETERHEKTLRSLLGVTID